jgi:hypothetical protein
MQAGEQVFLPSIHSSVCVCARDLKTERKVTSFDRLLVRTRPFLLGDGDSRISGIYTMVVKASISAGSLQFIPVNRHNYGDGIMNQTCT